MSQFDSSTWGSDRTPANTWFAIRNDPKQVDGNVVALWHRLDEDHELAFGAKDVKYIPHDDGYKRMLSNLHAERIDQQLVEPISSAEADMLKEIGDIPEIISDGNLHYLGKLRWLANQESDTPTSPPGRNMPTITSIGDVFAKVTLKRGIQATLFRAPSK